MAEQLTLTTPQSVTTYAVQSLILDWPLARIKVAVKDSRGENFHATYIGAEATNLMIALNKANLSILSLQRRILERLVADGKLPAGTVTGSPD